MTAIVDYGVGNLFSLQSSLRAVGEEVSVGSAPETLAAADRLLLPGVGAFGDAADRLRATGLDKTLLAFAASGRPLLGVCLGMQLLFEKSFEFGEHAGLGLILGSVCPLEEDLRAGGFPYKVPHIGWNPLLLTRPQSPLLQNTRSGDSVYYVHSFYAKYCEESVLAYSEYGLRVPGVVQQKNVCGTQFHPEKSGKVGLGILRAFCSL